MGICNCKERVQAININADISVPEGGDFPDEQNANFLKQYESKEESPISPKKKQFLKLKTQKNSDSDKSIVVDLSTEKLFMKGKTLKGMNMKNWKSNYTFNCNENFETAFTTKKSSAPREKSPKRSELLRKYTNSKESNSNIQNPYMVKKAAESNNSNIFESFNISNAELIYSLSHKDIDYEEEERLFNILQNHFLFQEFSVDMLKIIIDDLDGFQVEASTYVYKEGEEGNCFFIIKSGKMEVLSEGMRVKILQEGDCFGELALIQRCTRNSTLRTMTDCEFYVMEGEIYRKLNKKLTRMQIGDALFYLDSIPWLKTLDNTNKNTLAGMTTLINFDPNKPVLLANQREDEKVLILKQGQLSIRYKGKEIGKYHQKGEYFNEKWIFFYDPAVVEQIDLLRKCDIFSEDKSCCYVIPKTSLEEALGMSFREVILYSFFKASIAKSQFFSNFFIESQYEGLFQIFELIYYHKGEPVFINDSETTRKVSFILEGNLVDSKKYKIYSTKGEIFGEENLNREIPEVLIANPECLVLEATWDNIRDQLKNCSNSSMDIFRRINNLRKISIFKHSSESKLLQICQVMEEEKYKSGEYIFMEKTKGDKFYLLNKGRVRVIQRSKVVRELEEGNCFGELALLNEEKRTASVMSIDKVQCYTLTKEKFLNLIDDNMMDYLKTKLCLQDPELKLSDLYYLSFIGKGKFGSVYLTHNCTYLYAVKTLSRKSVDSQKSLGKYLISEKNILLSLDHPFIVKLVKTLKNEHFCYFILEFINGINMEEYLSSRKAKKDMKETKFYIASLLLIVDYLNSKCIAHRDIKPQNIMIDRNGYLKLIDFGTAKKISDFTHTVIGTPHYTAPEILIGKGYSFSCDFWSVGVTMYYIFYGIMPFGNEANDIMEVYKEILHKDLSFPESNNSYDINNFIQILLNKRISQRMCNLSALKSQYLFKDFPWDDLIDFKVKAPYIPSNIREWSNNLRNLSNPFEAFVSIDKSETYRQVQVCYDDQTPTNFNLKWFEEF